VKCTNWLVAMGLACLLALGVAACGGDDDDESGSGSGTGTAQTAAASCGTMSMAVIDDDSHRSGLWPMENGKVTSDVIDGVKVEYLQIPGLIQATGTKQYDVVQTALPGVALARARGADLRIVYFGIAHTGGGIRTFVAKDSSIQSPKDLKGKTLGVVSLGSTATLEASSVYNKRYGINAAPEGGDVKWTELDPPTLLNAVKKGQVDAGLMWHSWGWLASNDEALRPIDDLDDEYKAMTGQWPIGSAYTATAEQLEGKEHCYRALQKMLDESKTYAAEHIAEIAPEVSKKSGVPAEFIEYWWDGAYRFGGVDQQWIDGANALYKVAAESKVIPESPNLDEILLKPQA
jgi:NitT/TauT family transport system substrate-binding protein